MRNDSHSRKPRWGRQPQIKKLRCHLLCGECITKYQSGIKMLGTKAKEFPDAEAPSQAGGEGGTISPPGCGKAAHAEPHPADRAAASSII